ncbi:MAG: catalase [Microvirga sp.]|nr:catalase [Microvirga sp.]
MAAAKWQEIYDGTPGEERVAFEELARDILRVQLKTKRRSKSSAIQRTFHAKSILAVSGATLEFDQNLSKDLQAGYVQPGKSYPVTVRFSNAHGASQPDNTQDMRGVALRVRVSDSEQVDLLMTNFPVSHARNARQFVAFAVATAGNTLDRAFGLVRLIFSIGPIETLRMITNVRSARKKHVASLALETYWSRGAICWGKTLAVRYLLRPAAATTGTSYPSSADAGYLRSELACRLKAGSVEFDLCVQRYVDENKTPIEDTAVEWLERVSRPERVARLTICMQDVGSAEARTTERLIDDMAFNPWNTTDEFRPLGNLNRARKVVYDASAAHRLAYRWEAEVPWRNRLASRLIRRLFGWLNRSFDWHRLPLHASLLNLDAFRHVMRETNLIDTELREAPPQPRPVPPKIAEPTRIARTFDGTYNDLADPNMGAVGAAFGRNMPPAYRPDLFNVPNPVEVSKQLLYRDTFIPAKSLNILAAAWIQFQVHDWVNHARYKLGQKDVEVELPKGMTWANRVGGPAEQVMRIADNKEFRTGANDQPPILFANAASHWWDGSEVYGPDAKSANALREQINGIAGAKLRLDGGYLPTDCKGSETTGFNESWWLGLSAMHTLFAREHNTVCEALRSEYPHWSDEQVYQTARLVVSALIAKIHTIEWTPAILGTRAIEIALNSNWSGPPASDWLTRLALWIVDTHALKGIPKTQPDHHAAPYSLTEEFATVYRMHPLLPDDYQLFDYGNGSLLATKSFLDIQGDKTDDVMRQIKLTNVLYSFGMAYPGAIVLHNFPRTLQAFQRDGELIDLSVVDLVRTRRRGVPRYNDFRAGLHKPRVRRFEDLTSDPESVRRLREVYRDDIDLVDTMVGLFAETPPLGFGFSDTAFRVFLLMASRRLQSDRFLTVDFRPEVYSPLGMDWIERNGMTSVILRHCPELAAVMPRTGSAFAPWRPIAA